MRRGAPRARYERTDVLEILDAGLIAHVGVTTPDGPLVLPMVYGRDDERLYLHGAAANHLLGTGEGEEICVTVTHLDGLVMACTPFPQLDEHRSVVVRGLARRIDTTRKRKRYALKRVTDHVVANWDTSRPPSEIDLRRTLVLELPLAEASAKVRTGDPVDEPTTSPVRGGRAWCLSPPGSTAGGLRRLHGRRRAAGCGCVSRRPHPRRARTPAAADR